MLVLDAHCDTASALLDQKADLLENNCHIDLKRLLAAGERIQFFASFSNPFKFKNSSLIRILSIIDYIYRAQEQYSDRMSICLNSGDIDTAIAYGKVGAILSVEGGDALNSELSILRQLYRLGVRSMLLTWNHRNMLADGSLETHGAGLSDFGRQVVVEMNRLGMIIDVSHLCEASFREVLDLSNAPVIASHSNAKSVCSHPRNLSDEQLIYLKNKEGVVGITFYPFFLNNSGNASIDDVIRHIEHICSVIGEDNIGIGSDFDGIECVPAGIEGTQSLSVLFERLLTLNYSESFIEKFAGLNFMRVIRHILH
jgi:membrane dipeptidase